MKIISRHTQAQVLLFVTQFFTLSLPLLAFLSRWKINKKLNKFMLIDSSSLTLMLSLKMVFFSFFWCGWRRNFFFDALGHAREPPSWMDKIIWALAYDKVKSYKMWMDIFRVRFRGERDDFFQGYCLRDKQLW